MTTTAAMSADFAAIAPTSFVSAQKKKPRFAGLL
jgi:hypothetical protein